MMRRRSEKVTGREQKKRGSDVGQDVLLGAWHAFAAVHAPLERVPFSEYVWNTREGFSHGLARLL